MRWPDRLVLPLALAALAAGCARPLPRRVLARTRGGWTRTGPLVRYTPDNLFEYINGEAEGVIPYGLRAVTQGTYRRGEAESVVDIYDMGSAEGAFGLFRSHSSVGATRVGVGTEGVADEARVEFWQGRYYVAAAVPSPEAAKAVLALARGVAADLPPTAAMPAYLALLPTARRVARSEQWTPIGFLGQEALRDAVSAQYALPGRRAMVFACRYAAVAQAEAALASLRTYLGRKQAVRALSVGDGGFTAREEFLGEIAVFRSGRFLGGMTRYAKGASTDTLLADLAARLTRP